MLTIDGGYGEGGGQLVRTAAALSAVTGTAFRMTNIRRGRKKPGLAAQHLTAINAVAALCTADVHGAEIGADSFDFHPNALHGGNFRYDVGTAGSISLVLQACMLAAACAPEKSSIIVSGGTDVPMAPPIDYVRFVLLPVLERMGVTARIDVLRRGYYPRGGGKVLVEIEPAALRACDLSEQGAFHGAGGIVYASQLPMHVAQRIGQSAAKRLIAGTVGDSRISLATEQSDADSPGAGIVLWARYENSVLGASGLGKKGVASETVGTRAAEALVADMTAGATVDVHAADQILPYAALARGQSTFRTRQISEHMTTNIWLIRQFTSGRFTVSETEPSHTITVDGCGGM